MVITGRCKTIIDTIRKSLPEFYKLFIPLTKALGSNSEEDVITTLYAGLPKINFSKHILENITEYLYVMEMENVYWSDWGEEIKIKSDLNKLDILNTKSVLV